MSNQKVEKLCDASNKNMSLVFNCITDIDTNNISFEIKGNIR